MTRIHESGRGSRRPRTILLRVAVSLTLAAPGAVSQDSNVQSCITGLDWLLNSKGQTPCLTASYLESSCRPTRVDAIPDGTHYLGPQSPELANECLCSTITYSLVSACGACQGRNWAGWARWSTNCSTQVTSYGDPFPRPIPPAAEVPTWAYMDIRAQVNQSWSPSVAFAMGSKPLSTSSTSTTSPTNSPSHTPSSSGGGSNTGAIAGGVVGGVVFLVIVGLLIFWFILRKRKEKIPNDFQVDQDAKTQPTTIPGTTHNRSGSQAPMLNNFSPPPGGSTLPSLYGESPQVVPMDPPGYYPNSSRPLDMSEAGSVMPMSPSSAIYTTLPSRRSFESLTQSQPSQFGSLVSGPVRPGGGYTGAAELA